MFLYISLLSHCPNDNAFAYAVAVYMPSVTQQAALDAKEMLDSPILQPYGQADKDKSRIQSSNGFQDEKNPNIERPRTKVKQGPTGTVQADTTL